ncbi:MAG: ester cyclase [Parvularculaceae bacterium]
MSGEKNRDEETRFQNQGARPDKSLSRRAFSTKGLMAAGAAAAASAVGAAAMARGEDQKSKQEENKAIVGRWFADFWGKSWNPKVIDDLAAPDMLLQYSLHAPRRGRDDIRAFITDFRAAFPDLGFSGTADLIAEGDYVVGRWIGGGTHTGPAFSDFLAGSLPPATGRKMWFSGTTVIRIENGKIAEEIGLDDGVTALTQLKLISTVR